jgi:hypothetical protein
MCISPKCVRDSLGGMIDLDTDVQLLKQLFAFSSLFELVDSEESCRIVRQNLQSSHLERLRELACPVLAIHCWLLLLSHR